MATAKKSTKETAENKVKEKKETKKTQVSMKVEDTNTQNHNVETEIGVDKNIENDLISLYKLQTTYSKIDKVRVVRGELPLEVSDLEDVCQGLQTRLSNFAEMQKETETNIYTIKSDLGCYLCEDNFKLKCSFGHLTRFCKFYLLKIYSEVEKDDEHDLELIEKEPIDVLVKYIDLSDPKLKREGIKQINKDQQNDELRYSLRSILQNIPWVRKIFILMPNENVKFLKSPELISDKIVFVKDKDLLGYDSANSHAFQFRYWKMKEYGMSDNFIAMDDDCFIGKPLNKSDFFYVQNGTVVPAIIATNYQVHTKKTFLREYNTAKKNIRQLHIVCYFMKIHYM